MKERILVLGAHSDDQILGPGGTIAKYARKGKAIKTIIFSYGEGSHPHLKRDVAVKMRVKEAQQADKIIGGDGVVFLGLTETKFQQEIHERKIDVKLMHIIKKFRPHKIFTHSDVDVHPDHRVVTKTILNVIKTLDYKCDIYIYPIWNVFRFTKRDLPKMYVDVTKTFHIKIKALKAFSSQWMAMVLLIWSVYFRAILNGLKIKKMFAERFYKIK